jgi:hypothetical protein
MRGDGLQGLSCAHEAQIKFGDLTPYLTHGTGHFDIGYGVTVTLGGNTLKRRKYFRRLPKYPHYIHLGQRLWLRPCQRPAQGQEGVRLRGGRPRARLPPRPCAGAQHDRPARHSQQSSG